MSTCRRMLVKDYMDEQLDNFTINSDASVIELADLIGSPANIHNAALVRNAVTGKIEQIATESDLTISWVESIFRSDVQYLAVRGEWLSEDCPVEDAARILKSDLDGAGVLTVKDLLRSQTGMSTIKKSDSVYEALKQFKNTRFRRLAVTDDSGEIVGLLSLKVLTYALAQS